MAVDAATGEMVASWDSVAGGGGDFIGAVAPTLGRCAVGAGIGAQRARDRGPEQGPGVDGGGSVPVGKLSGVSANALGAATGLDGRMWVMWGQDGVSVAVTRSDRAVTRFEPIQHLNPSSFTLYRLSGDGRLGWLELFVEQIPNSKSTIPPAGSFYARVLPELSATVSAKTVKNKTGKVIAHRLKVRVNDAGDIVTGAKVSAAGAHTKTTAKGVAKLTLKGSSGGKITVTITDSGYQKLKKKTSSDPRSDGRSHDHHLGSSRDPP